MARQARKALADMRAMEEEGERLNPVNPKKALKMGAVSHSDVPRTGIMGAGATPSMGLSPFHGGGKLEITHDSSDSDEECAMEAGRKLSEHIKGLHGAGYLKKFHAGMMSGGIDTGAYEGQGARGISGGAHVVGGAKKAKAPAAVGGARAARGAAVSRLMKEKGMTLGEASRHIKEHGME